jgi:glycosyltransferase involved in cell wall biosynthesis
MKILVISSTIPYPPNSGARLRLYSLLEQIARQHQVWLAALFLNPADAQGVPTLREMYEDVLTVQRKRRHPIAHLPGLVRFAAAGIPLEFKFYHMKEFARKLQQLCDEVEFDVVQFEEPRTAQYLRYLPPDLQKKSVLTLYDISYTQAASLHAIETDPVMRWRYWIHGQMTRRWEPRGLAQFARVCTVSSLERDLLLEANPHLNIEVIPNGVDTLTYTPLPPADSVPALVYVGNMAYLPSRDGALYLCEEILPLVWRDQPEVEAWVVGASPPEQLLALDDPRVHVTGLVDDVVTYYQRSAVSVVPLRAGGGTRLKILEAMALGRPIVSTTIGREGLDVLDGQHLLVADDPRQFADHVLRLLADEALRDDIVSRARQLVEEQYAWHSIAQNLIEVYQEISTTDNV